MALDLSNHNVLTTKVSDRTLAALEDTISNTGITASQFLRETLEDALFRGVDKTAEG